MANGNRLPGKVLLIALALVLVGVTLVAEPSPQQANKVARASAPKRTGGQLTPRQIERMEARIEAATTIVNRLEQEARSLGRGPGWRKVTLDSLLALPMSQLERVGQRAHGADEIPAAIVEATTDPQLLGDPDEDLVYVPLPPCRFIDTRLVAGRFFGFREYDIALPGSTYGGDATCQPTTNFGVGDDEIGALAMNLTIINPANAPGFAAAKPTQNAPLSSLANWYEIGEFVQAANQGIVALDLSSAAPEFVVQTSAQVHVIVDIFGAFLPPVATALEVTEVQTPWSILAHDFDVTATCPAGDTVTGGGFNHSSGTLGGVLETQSSKDGSNNRWRCRGISLGILGIGSTGFCQAVCARTPGR